MKRKAVEGSTPNMAPNYRVGGGWLRRESGKAGGSPATRNYGRRSRRHSGAGAVSEARSGHRRMGCTQHTRATAPRKGATKEADGRAKKIAATL